MIEDKVIFEKSTVESWGNAIRTKKGTTEQFPASQLEQEILSIETRENLDAELTEQENALGTLENEIESLDDDMRLQKPFNLVSYINGTLTEIDDTYGVIKSVGLYWSSSTYGPVFSYSVGGLSFMNNTQLKTVNLPECVSVYNSAFLSCSSLEYVSLPKCEYISGSAFSSCDNLSRIDLPACKTLSNYAFNRTSSASISLTINIPDYCDLGVQQVHSSRYGSNYYWSANGNKYAVAFSIESTTLHPSCFVIGNTTHNTNRGLGTIYGEGVRWVCTNAFSNNNLIGVSTINLPNCERVRAAAFGSLSSLTSVMLPKCSYVGANAFSRASLLTDITGIGATYIGAGAFYSARSLTTANWSIIEYLGKGAFYGNTIFTELPSELTNCSYLCGFTGSPVLEKAHHSTAKTICFQSCSVLSDISFPACEVLEDNAFGSCPNLALTGEEFPKCRVVGSYAFAYNSTITKVVMPKCERIENNAFYQCSSISQISIDNCEYIGSSAFYSNNALESISLGNCKYIGQSAFSRCYLLSDVDLRNCSYIGGNAFDYCSNITEINLQNCELIDGGAFNCCSNLSSVLVPKLKWLGGLNLSQWPSSAFYSCPYIEEIDFPELEVLNCSFYMTQIGTFKFSKLSYVCSSAFYSASRTYSIYIYASSVPVLTVSAYAAFYRSPIYSGAGKIYVPESLYSEYRIATNWAALPASAFVSF